MDARQARHARRRETQKCGHCPGRREEAEPASREREGDAFGQQVAGDPPAARAERRPHGDLAGLPGHASQRQVREVRADDQEHEPSRRQEHEERPPYVADEGLGERPEADLDPGVRRGILLLQAAGKQEGFLSRAFRRNAGLDVRDGAEDPQGAVGSLLRRGREREIEGDPELEVGARELELRRHDADDRVRLAAQRDRAAENRTVSRETGPPEMIGQDDHGLVHLCGKKNPSQARGGQQRKEVGGDDAAEELLGFAAGGERVLVGGEDRDAIERAVGVPEVPEVGNREVRDHQAVHVAVRQGPQENPAHDREDRRVRADAQGQRQHRHGGEAGAPAEGSQRVSQFAEKSGHGLTSRKFH